jgi:prevent-host-death family protein
MTTSHQIGAGEFKSKCLKLLDIVAETHEPLLITKHGKGIAQLVPVPPEVDLCGALSGSVLFEGDIVAPLENTWDANRCPSFCQKRLPPCSTLTF